MSNVTRRRERVALCMIVRNEEANLPDCLGPIADLFDEVIVVDTGSTDGTKDCARRLGTKVYDFAWVDSFAAARNESLRHARCEWIFWLDGDERLDKANLDKLRRLFDELPGEKSVYMMCQRSKPDQLTGATLIVDQARLFRNLPQARWRYRCHEQILVSLKEQGAKEVRTDIVIEHLGYEKPELRKRKRERNLRLLEQELQENPRDAFVLFNLANANIDDGRVQEALGFLHRCLECAPARASFMPKAYRQLAGSYHALGRADDALTYCREGKKQYPKSIALWFHEGILLLARGDLEGARHCFETVLTLPSQENYTGIDANLAGCRTRHNLAYVYGRLGLARQAEEQWRLALAQTPEFEPPWLALLELYLEQKRQLEAEGLLLQLEGKTCKEAIAPALEARLTLARGDLGSARLILERALVRNPQTLWLRNLLADILLRVAGDDKAAEQHLRTILALSPNESQARQKLGEILSKRPGEVPAGAGPRLVTAKESAERSTKTTPLRIVWQGAQKALHSLALVNREICCRLIAHGHELSLIRPTNFELERSRLVLPKSLQECIGKKLSGPADFHVSHQWPPHLQRPPRGRWVIVQPWEFGSLPRAWIPAFTHQVDELWVPSTFVRECFIQSGVPGDKVYVIPNGVSPALFQQAAPFKLKTKRRFRYLFVGGTIERKGIDLLLHAYHDVFTAEDDVCLVIKDMGGTSFYHGQTAERQIAQYQRRPNAPEVECIAQDLGAEEMAGLYAACQCLVHPYRGEGFGLPIAEAMAAGLPVVVTGLGAALDYCHEEHAYLIPARMVHFREKRIGELETVDFPWWAEPDEESLRVLLLHVVKNQEEAKAKGARAQTYIREHFTWDHSVAALEMRLQKRKKWDADRLFAP